MKICQILQKRTLSSHSILNSVLLRNEALRSPSLYWDKVAKDVNIHWYQPYVSAHDENSTDPLKSWFVRGQLNMSYNCLDLHIINGNGNNVAIIYESPVTQTITKITYKELFQRVNQFSAGLLKIGISKGDRSVIYMSNSIECVIAMLSCARLGVTHSVVFGGFAANELATRIKDFIPNVIIISSCGIEGSKVIPYQPIVEKALELVAADSTTHANGIKVKKCVVLQRNQGIATLGKQLYIDWKDLIKDIDINTVVGAVSVATDHPLYCLYTSGTTGSPKGVVRDTGGYAIALKWSMKYIYNISNDDIFWAASDVGWVVGHSYSVYGPLLIGATTVLYEGKPVGTPDFSQFWRMIERHKVNVFFTAPTAIRAIKRVDSHGKAMKNFDLSSLKAIFLAGERADPDTLHYLENELPKAVAVRDHYWSTESGSPICSNMTAVDGYDVKVKYGSSFTAVPGFDVQVLDSNQKQLTRGNFGSIVIKLPLPPGFLIGLHNAKERLTESYFQKYPGYFDTGDCGYIDVDDYVYILSRSDDVINVAGHRISTSSIEEVLTNHIDIAEAAVVGIKDSFRGQIPLGLVILNKETTKDSDLIVEEVVEMVRSKIGAFVCFKIAYVVDRLPKTRSGKILRTTIRSIANNQSYIIPSTIEDASVLKDIETIIRSHES